MNPGDTVQVQLPGNVTHAMVGVFDHWVGKLAMVTLGTQGQYAFNPYDLVPAGTEGDAAL